MEPTLPTQARAGAFQRLRVPAELLALLAACVASLGPSLLLPGQEALGHPTRDLFDHLALLDHWALTAPEQAFPDGGSLFPPDPTGMALAALPLALGLPRATAWNWMVLGQLYLACVGAWALGRRYGAGLVAGVAFGLSPYLVGQALTGESETLAAWPLPVAALLLEQAADRWRGRAEGSPRGRLVAAGLVAAVGALGAWYYGAFLALYLCAWVAVRAWTRAEGQRRRFVPQALLAPAAFAVAIAGPAAIYARILGQGDQLFRGPEMADYLERFPRSLAGMVADPAAFFGPSTAGIGHVDALGAVIVGLALLGTLRGSPGREPARWWWGVVLVALVLALGPVLHVRGAPIWQWMPYRALADLPVFGLMRLPHRWLLVVSLGLAVLAARGGKDIAWLAAFLVWGETSWIVVPHRPATDISPPAVVEQVDGPVLDLPPRTIGMDARGRYLVWQRTHRQPIAYTLLMRTLGPSIAAEPLVQAISGLDHRDPLSEKLSEAEQFHQGAFARAAAPWRHGRGNRAALDGAADRLRALGYELVVLHLDLVTTEDRLVMDPLLREVLGEPALANDEVVLWRL